MAAPIRTWPTRPATRPLHTAAQLGDVDLVKKLVAKGADPNARTAKTAPGGRGGGGGGPFRQVAGEQTPLMLAAKANHPEVDEGADRRGADPKLKAQDGSTLLMAAVGSGHVEVVKYVYELDPDVKAVTTTGGTRDARLGDRHHAELHAARDLQGDSVSRRQRRAAR